MVTSTTATQTPAVAQSADLLADFLGDRNFVMAFARGMLVIQAFGSAPEARSVAELSQRSRVPRAAVRRLLHTLAELGFVRVIGQRYALTAKTLELGHAFTSSNRIAIAIQPIVSRLAERLHSFCALSVLQDDETMLMCQAGTAANPVADPDRATLGDPAPLRAGAGGRAPLYASASGQLFLANFSEAQLNAYFARVAMTPLTFRTQTLPAQLRESLPRVRAQGYAVGDRIFANDLRSIAVAVNDERGTMVAAMVSVVRTEVLSDTALHQRWLPALRQAAHDAGRVWRG